MSPPATPLESVGRFVEERLDEARRKAEAGDRRGASSVLLETIDELLTNRNSYVNFHRGVGSVLGGSVGLLLASIIPGGHTLSALAALFGWGYFGERLGRYAGERLSEEDYLQKLVDLHRELVRVAPPGEPPLHHWRSLVVLETPFEIFSPILEGQGLGRSWAGVKNLLGFDPFALALEHAREEFASWPTLLAMARALLDSPGLPPEAEALARALYGRVRTDLAVNQLLGRVYFTYRGKGVDAIAFQHRERYSEDVMELFTRDYDGNPRSESSIVNLSTLLARRGLLEERWAPAYLAHFRLDRASFQAAAGAVRSLTELAPHQDLLEAVLAHPNSVPLPEADRLRVLEARARHLASAGDLSPPALDLYRRLLAASHVPDVAMRLALHLLGAGNLAALTRPVATTAFERREALDAPARQALARFFRAEASMNPADAFCHLATASLMVESGAWKEAAALLEDFQVRARSPGDRLDTLAELARIYRTGGQYARAFEYYRGVCLVRPGPELVAEVFSLHEELRERRERPALLRELLLLVKTVAPGHRSPSGATLDELLAEHASVFDNYLPESIEKVGGGGMAEVFRGRHRTSGELHIIKKLRTDFGTADEMERFAELFGREIRAIKKINRSDHPGARHVITLFHESAEESHFCYSMEALDEVLSERLTRLGPFPAQTAAPLLAEIASGLAAAHAAGVVHRDLNPRNIGFRDGVAKLFDFGTAHILRTTLHITRTPRNPDYILGTPCYMSPEQSTGDPFDERTDLFSLGCVCYELLTGELAFPGQVGSLVLLHDPGCETRLRARLLELGAPAPLVGLLLQTLAARKEARCRSAQAFIDRLEGVATSL